MGAGSRRAAPRRSAPGRPGGQQDGAALAVLLRPAVEALGLDLEDVRITAAGRRRLVRVVVDGDGGITLDDIADVSRDVVALLDARDPFGPAPYTVEVSSPGVDRPLTEPRHWRRAAGRLVTVPVGAADGGRDRADGSATADGSTTADGSATADTPPLAGGSRIEGRVTKADDVGVTIEVDGVPRNFRYAELGPGRVQVEFGPLAVPRDEEECDGH
jgi:ribosome maturation factor RimP